MTSFAHSFRPLAVAVAASAALATAAFGAPSAAHAATAHTAAAHTNGFARHVHVAPDLMKKFDGKVPDASKGGKIANEQSENWSGYIKSGSSGAYTSSTATWTVPTVSTADNGYSSTWVGIDGASSGDQYLIQTGTEADMQDGQSNYDAWWEVITPTDEAPETLFSNLSVSPGDSITATVAKGSGGKWSMTLTDNTTGQSASHSSSYAGPGESAEWIQEDTDVNGDISTAPDWGSVSFSNIAVNGAAGALDGADAVDIYDSNGTQEDSTSAPNGSDNGFTVTWLATGTETPTS